MKRDSGVQVGGGGQSGAASLCHMKRDSPVRGRCTIRTRRRLAMKYLIYQLCVVEKMNRL